MIAKKLHDLRVALNLSRPQMAALLGLQRGTYTKWEQSLEDGKGQPPPAIAGTTADLLLFLQEHKLIELWRSKRADAAAKNNTKKC